MQVPSQQTREKCGGADSNVSAQIEPRDLIDARIGEGL
jgi:hypothetical protein